MGLDRAAAAEFSFFVAIPTMSAAFAHEFLEVRDQLTPARALEIAVGFAMAFISSLLIIKPFLGFVAARRDSRRSRGIASRSASALLAGDRRRVGARMMSWLRRRFVTGFFVLVPLVVSIVALIWVFRVVDGFTAPLYERYFGSTTASACPRGWAS